MSVIKQNIEIRDWSKEDLPIIRKLALKSWLETYNNIFSKKDIKLGHRNNYSISMLNKNFIEKVGHVALIDKEIIGYLIAQNQIENDRFYINSLYVLKKFQGLGIGKKLLNTTFQISRQYGYDRVWLDVFSGNIKAINWYKRQNFVFVEQAQYKMGDAYTETNICYKLI